MILYYYYILFYIKIYNFCYKLKKKYIKSKKRNNFFALFSEIEKNLSKKKDSNYKKIHIIALLEKRNGILDKKLIAILEKNIGYKINNLEQLVEYEKTGANIIDYKKLIKNKLFITKLFKNNINIFYHFCLASLVILLGTTTFITINSSVKIIQNFQTLEEEEEKKEETKVNENTNPKQSGNKESTNNQNVKNDENGLETENTINNDPTKGDLISYKYNSDITSESGRINEQKKIEATDEEGNLTDENSERDINKNGKQNEEKDFSYELGANNDTLLDSIYDTVVNLDEKIPKNELLSIFIKSILGILGTIFISSILVNIFKKVIYVYILLLLITNILIYYFNLGFIIGNIIFSLLIIIGTFIYIVDLINKNINIDNNKLKIKFYYYFRTFFFLFISTVFVFFFLTYILYILDIKFFNKVNELIGYSGNYSELRFESHIYIIGMILLSSIVFIKLLNDNIYYNIKKIFNNHMNIEEDFEELKILIEKGTDDEIHKYLIENEKNIIHIRRYLLYFLYTKEKINTEHIKYLINKSKKYANIEDILFNEEIKLNYPKKYFSNKINNILYKKHKDDTLGQGEYKIISYLDKGDDNTHISKVNIKKSIKTGEIIMNIFEYDDGITNIENLSINIVELLKKENLSKFKHILKKLNSKQLRLKNIYLYRGNKFEKLIYFSTSKNLIKNIEQIIQKIELKGQKIRIPAFMKQDNNKNLELIFNIAFNKIEVIKKTDTKNDLDKIKHLKNNLLLGF